jgi:ATP-binding cassette subfamily F protein uup
VGEGNDTVTVNGRTQHVLGYLSDFLFPKERAESPVKALSGGERNRLLLARLFTRPANVLVLDEPTNDLDIETLELLESYLVDWPGTLLLVSHDRAFIDDVVTSTLVFEGGGRVQEYVGGYEDWLRQRVSPEAQLKVRPAEPPVVRESSKSPVRRDSSRASTAPAKKLSYREQQEMRELPPRIDALEREQAGLNALTAEPTFYRSAADTIKNTLARLDAIQRELLGAYARWNELDSRHQR